MNWLVGCYEHHKALGESGSERRRFEEPRDSNIP